MNYELQIGLLSIVVASFALGFIIGRRRGYKLGRDEQWLETFFRDIERSKSKRDEAGRFKKISFSN